MNTHVYAADRLEQLVIYSTGGHKDAVVGSFFLNNSLDVSLLYNPCITIIFCKFCLVDPRCVAQNRELSGWYDDGMALGLLCMLYVLRAMTSSVPPFFLSKAR